MAEKRVIFSSRLGWSLGNTVSGTKDQKNEGGERSGISGDVANENEARWNVCSDRDVGPMFSTWVQTKDASSGAQVVVSLPFDAYSIAVRERWLAGWPTRRDHASE